MVEGGRGRRPCEGGCLELDAAREVQTKDQEIVRGHHSVIHSPAPNTHTQPHPLSIHLLSGLSIYLNFISVSIHPFTSPRNIHPSYNVCPSIHPVSTLSSIISVQHPLMLVYTSNHPTVFQYIHLFKASIFSIYPFTQYRSILPFIHCLSIHLFIIPSNSIYLSVLYLAYVLDTRVPGELFHPGGKRPPSDLLSPFYKICWKSFTGFKVEVSEPLALKLLPPYAAQ